MSVPPCTWRRCVNTEEGPGWGVRGWNALSIVGNGVPVSLIMRWTGGERESGHDMSDIVCREGKEGA
jgi:hypothetical protein